MNELTNEGWTMIRANLASADISLLKERAFGEEPGRRCQLDQPAVRTATESIRVRLTEAGLLAPGAVAIQAIAFDKTAGTNWKVTWHQDLMFPFARAVTTPGYETPSIKDGVHYARPPREILEGLLAARLHLDDCDESKGPLRVIPSSHRDGIFKSAEISERVATGTEKLCLAEEGDVLLMKPLLLHASSPASVPTHRRVLHFVYHSGQAPREPWYRSV